LSEHIAFEQFVGKGLHCAATTLSTMPYTVEGPQSATPRTGMLQHLLGMKGLSGHGSRSTADSVIPNQWQGDGKVVVD